MKKKLGLVVLTTLVATSLVACGDKTPKEDKSKEVGEEVVREVEGETQEEVGFKEEDGKLVRIERDEKIFDLPAMKIVADKEAKELSFIPADEEGNTAADYFIFDLENEEFKKYYYVSAMATGHYYYYDLANNELVRVEDNDREDATEGTKQSGRWEKALEKIEGEIEELEEYFEKIEGKTIREFMEE